MEDIDKVFHMAAWTIQVWLLFLIYFKVRK